MTIGASTIRAAIERYVPASSDTVLTGDSMTSQYEVDNTPDASYNPTSGILTFTNLTNPISTGMEGIFFNRSYTSVTAQKRIVLNYISSTSAWAQLETNLDGLPDGALTGTNFLRLAQKRGSNSWFVWMQMALHWPFKVVYNGAQSGDTTQQCLDRLDTDCLAFRPSFVFMQIPGINDTTAAQTIGDDEIHANQMLLVERITQAGAFLFLLPLTPLSSHVVPGEGRATLNNMSRVQRLNQMLLAGVRDLRNVCVINAYNAVVDPTDTTGRAVAAYIKSGDNIHYAIPGARAVGTLASTTVGKLVPTAQDTRPVSTIDCYANSAQTASSLTVTANIATFNLNSHGFRVGESVRIAGATLGFTGLNKQQTIVSAATNSFTFATEAVPDGTASGTITASRNRNIFNNPVLATGTGGAVSAGVTGTAASLLNVRNQSGAAGGLTATTDVVAHPDGYGSVQRIQITAAALDDLPGYQTNSTTTMLSAIQRGRSYQFEAYWSLASTDWSLTPISELMARLILSVDGVLVSVFALNTYDGLAVTGSITSDAVLHLQTPPLLIPMSGTLNSCYFQVYTRAAGTFGVATLTQLFGQIAVRDVTDEL